MVSRREALAALLAMPAGALPASPTDWTLQQASEQVRKGKISPVELTRACLERIERLNPQLNAFITVMADQARAQAGQLEAEGRAGKWRGPLHGIPIGLKDLIDTEGVKTTCASAVFANRVPAEDAEVVRRLKRAGAVLIGKQNMHEFAYGGTSVPSHYGAVHNPWNPDRIAGGSSGGPAAAVAAGLCFGALGSDTAGSIRQPAAYCGITGLKPTYGRVSTRGVVPLSWSLDHIGPLCRTATDAALLVEAIAGYDPLEPTSVDWPVERYSAMMHAKTATLRVGVARRFFFEQIDPEVEAAANAAIDVVRKMTAEVREVELPSTPVLPIVAAEAYAFHAPYFTKSPDLYQPETRERVKQGATVTTVAYVEARRELDRLRRAAGSLFSTVDVVITPTTPTPPITIEEARQRKAPPPGTDPLARNTRLFNVLGLPAISVPCGFTRSGLPIGLHIAGPRFAEGRVLAVAHDYQQATDWHTRRPAIA
ncbi:MAG: amidase [Acidobacteria bacterium]|nr:amidase [Acidobacteriota bacterium]